MAACQPTVRAMFLFHVTDESNLDRWQSGVYYADGTPKSTRAVVKQAIEQIDDRTLDCSLVAPEDDGWTEIPDTPSNAKAHRAPGASSLWTLLSG
jgi:hypothetical protein